MDVFLGDILILGQVQMNWGLSTINYLRLAKEKNWEGAEKYFRSDFKQSERSKILITFYAPNSNKNPEIIHIDAAIPIKKERDKVVEFFQKIYVEISKRNVEGKKEIKKILK